MTRPKQAEPTLVPPEVRDNRIRVSHHPDLGVVVDGILDAKSLPSGTALTPYGSESLARVGKQAAELLDIYHGVSAPVDALQLVTFVPRKPLGGYDFLFEVRTPERIDRDIANLVLAPKGGKVMPDPYWKVDVKDYLTVPEGKIQFPVSRGGNNTVGILPFLISAENASGAYLRSVVAAAIEGYMRLNSQNVPTSYRNRTLSWLLENCGHSPLFPDDVILGTARSMGIANVPGLRTVLGSMKTALTEGIPDYRSPPVSFGKLLARAHAADPQHAYSELLVGVMERAKAQKFRSADEVGEFIKAGFQNYLSLPSGLSFGSGKATKLAALNELATQLYKASVYCKP